MNVRTYQQIVQEYTKTDITEVLLKQGEASVLMDRPKFIDVLLRMMAKRSCRVNIESK